MTFRTVLTRRRFTCASIWAIAAMALAPLARADEIVNIYSYRQPQLIEPVLAAFTKKTGIRTAMIYADQGLVERLVQEGDGSPADVLLTVDVGRLVEAAKQGAAQPVTSPAVLDNVPAALRDTANQWFGLTMRARIILASKERTSFDKLTYDELADPKFKGKICTRSGQHPYNLGLIAAMIAHEGPEKAKAWLEGVKANLARRPAGDDRAQAKAVWAGECDLAMSNTYYMGKMATNEKEPEQKEWAASVRVVFPTFENGASHVNISGMLMAKNAPHKENALKLMEFLASDEAQQLYASQNFEYPVNPDVKPVALVQSWGTLVPDTLPIAKIAELQAEASKLVDEVGFDQ
ncbi:MAG: Fe(3+) ABC transporter substrate-binding protein [Hyphomicrobiales bacterium]